MVRLIIIISNSLYLYVNNFQIRVIIVRSAVSLNGRYISES